MGTWLDLRPTLNQYNAFAEYLCNAHSWYKHLPLLEGRTFLVFVTPSAGTGRRIIVPDKNNSEIWNLEVPPEGDNYTDETPRLHYAWKTTQEYRTRFGFLSYIDYEDSIDSESLVSRFPPNLIKHCSFTLYPYVSAGYFSEAVHYSCHEDALEQLRKGFEHPLREELIRFADIPSEMYDVQEEMNDEEQRWVSEYDELDGEWKGEYPSPRTNTYVQLNHELDSLTDLFYRQELNKIQQALKELDKWLMS
jgi:hypothetical protein